MSKALQSDEQMDQGPGRTGQVEMDDHDTLTTQPHEGRENVGEGRPRPA